MLSFTEEQLHAMGYREVRPGRFSRVAPPSKAPQKKKKHASAAAHAGKYDIDGTVYNFRSGWEYLYALYLQAALERGEISKWEFEPKTFWFNNIQRGTKSYLPDFKITMPDGSHWWAEVKGYMDSKSQTKLKRMAKYYPEEKIVLIQEAEITKIKNSGLISKDTLLMMAAKAA